MAFVDVYFEDGNINTILAGPKAGKSNLVVDMGDKAIKYGYTVLSNIAFFKEHNIEEAKKRGWLNKNINYRPKPEKFKYIPLASQLILEAATTEKNIVIIDEGGISASSSKALSDSVVQFKFLGYSIRKIGSCLIIIAQSKRSVVPDLRKEIVDYEIHVLRQPNGRRDIDILKSIRFYDKTKRDYVVAFDQYDYRVGIPESRIAYDTRHPGGFKWDIDLRQFYDTIALSGYDSIEIRDHIPRIIKSMVADRKIEEHMKQKQFMGTGKVADLFKVSTKTITRWADQGLLKCIKTNKGDRLFSKYEVSKLAQEKNIF